MNHKMHRYLMIGLAVVAVLLFSTGNGGGWLPLVFVVTFVVMVIHLMGEASGDPHRRRARGENKLSPTPGHDSHR